MLAIMKRELRAYYQSMTGYIFDAFLLLFTGLYTMGICLMQYYPNFEYVLGNSSFIFLLIVPILTMRTFAEERKQRTDQLLYSLPTGMPKIVFGKYLALVMVFIIPLVIIMFYPLILTQFGEVNFKTAYTTVLAYFLMGCALLAIGMFISTLTESQLVSAALCFVVLLVDYMADQIGDYVPVGSSVVKALCLFTPMNNFIYGLFDVRGIVLYLCAIILFVFLTIQSLEKRRWG